MTRLTRGTELRVLRTLGTAWIVLFPLTVFAGHAIQRYRDEQARRAIPAQELANVRLCRAWADFLEQRDTLPPWEAAWRAQEARDLDSLAVLRGIR